MRARILADEEGFPADDQNLSEGRVAAELIEVGVQCRIQKTAGSSFKHIHRIVTELRTTPHQERQQADKSNCGEG